MKLKELRNSRNLTQQHLADYLKVTQTTYNYYEKGKSEPNIQTLCKLADFYNVSLDYLVGRTNFAQSKIASEMLDVISQLQPIEQGCVLGYAKKTLEDVKLAKEKELKNKLKQQNN